MKKIFSIFIFLFCTLFTYGQVNNLQLQGIIDFDLVSAGYTGKAIHLKANSNIPDLSVYGIGVANNGNGGDGQEYLFPQMSLQSGDHLLLVRDSSVMSIYFDVCFVEFDHVLPASNAIDQNGNDAIELYKDSMVIETFGDINMDGTGTAWEYLDSWAYKDPSGSVTFSGYNWIFGGVECTIGSVTTQASSCPYPLCSSSSNVYDYNNRSFSIFPNPSNEYIKLDTDYIIESITIFNAMGQKITNFEYEDNILDVKNLPNGIYVLNSIGDKKTITQTFIKY
ncbi:MAG: T9SS type A sorting domain-containing protein [Flavobacteriales bacterium]|nr:T9SS type A sorting domain-containing protein [Flavobacteriales bacterium]